MGEVKWIKIVTDLFNDEKIMMIESLPSADSIIVIWFKLLCLAGRTNNNGVFLMNDKVAYTEEMLATIFRRDLNTVRLALNTFEELGMIEIYEGVITIPNWNKHQTLDAYEKKKERDRIYQQKRREAQRLLIDKSSDKSFDKSSDVAISDIEEDKDKEKDNISSSKDNELLKQIVDYLNSQTGKSFKANSKATQRHILARINEGYSLEDFKAVIDIKVKQWLGDSKMNMYLRPETLFAGHFEGYLNEAPKKKVVEKPKNTNLEKVVDCPWDDPTTEQEAAFDADREAHKFEDGWRINDDGYWINPEKGIV